MRKDNTSHFHLSNLDLSNVSNVPIPALPQSEHHPSQQEERDSHTHGDYNDNYEKYTEENQIEETYETQTASLYTPYASQEGIAQEEEVGGFADKLIVMFMVFVISMMAIGFALTSFL